MSALVLYKFITKVNGEQSVMIAGAGMKPTLLVANLVLAHTLILGAVEKID